MKDLVELFFCQKFKFNLILNNREALVDTSKTVARFQMFRLEKVDLKKLAREQFFFQVLKCWWWSRVEEEEEVDFSRTHFVRSFQAFLLLSFFWNRLFFKIYMFHVCWIFSANRTWALKGTVWSWIYCNKSFTDIQL